MYKDTALQMIELYKYINYTYQTFLPIDLKDDSSISRGASETANTTAPIE